MKSNASNIVSQNIKFSIITPTYKRPEELLRSVNSVLEQNYSNFEIIIVNDSPTYDYSFFTQNLNTLQTSKLDKGKIKYIENKENMGVNYSRNLALSKISQNPDYIIFLDDDDWLAENALKNIYEALISNKKIEWLVTNLNLNNGKSITNSHIKSGYFSYFWDYLIFKKFKGDPTHTIKTSLILNKKHKIKFSEKVKNGEEWSFFIKLEVKPYYKNINTKMTNGYEPSGLTQIGKVENKFKNLNNIKILFLENRDCKTFLYLFLRIISVLIYNLKLKIKNMI